MVAPIVRRQIPSDSDIPLHGWFPYGAMHKERIRAHRKHGPAGSMEFRKWDDPAWLPVLVEEIGEVARVLCERALGNFTDEQSIEELARELVQCGAMTAAWLEALREAKK